MGSQTQQANTQTGFPDQESDLPFESDKSTRCHQKVQNRWNRPKGRFFRVHPWYLVLKLTSFSQVDWTAEKITELPRPAASAPVKKFVDIGVL